MAYPDYSTMSRTDLVNNAGGDYAMNLKQFSGEILESFERNTMLLDKVKTRNISGGREAQFPLTGRATAEYHTLGTEIVPNAQKVAERTLTIDGEMVAHDFSPNFTDMISHFDTRSEKANQLGEALAYNTDRHLITDLRNASHATKAIDDADQYDGLSIQNDAFHFGASAGASTTKNALATALIEGIYAAAEVMDERFVKGDRFCMLRPQEYYALVTGVQSNGFSAIHADYNGKGSLAEGKILEIGGVKILKAPTLPSTNITATGINAYHNADMSDLKGLVFTGDAIGMLRLAGLKLETEYDMLRRGTTMVASQAVGSGILRPECAIALETDTLTNASA